MATGASAEHDFTDLVCPMLLVQIKLAIKQAPTDSQLRFRVTDPQAAIDLAKLSRRLACRIEQHRLSDSLWLVSVYKQRP